MTTKTLPPGCKCNPYDWPGDAAITPICEEYTLSVREGCYYCGHRPECHAVSGDVNMAKRAFYENQIAEAVDTSASNLLREFYYLGVSAREGNTQGADEVDNRPADERDVDSLHEIVGLLLYRLGRAAKENASLIEQLADRGGRNKNDIM